MTTTSFPAHGFPYPAQQPTYHEQHNQQTYYPPPPIAASPTTPPDAIEALNVRVLQRYLPSLHSLIFRTPYAVVYTFSTDTASWEKIGKEGTLFIVRLYNNCVDDSGAVWMEVPERPERYAVVVLNRRGLENFILQIGGGNDDDEGEDDRTDDGDDGVVGGVQVEGEYIILQGTMMHEDEERKDVFGLWVFEEEGGSTKGKREECASVLRECKRRCKRKQANNELHQQQDTHIYEPQHQRPAQPQDFFSSSASSQQAPPSYTQASHANQNPTTSTAYYPQQTQSSNHTQTSTNLLALLNGHSQSPPHPQHQPQPQPQYPSLPTNQSTAPYPSTTQPQAPTTSASAGPTPQPGALQGLSLMNQLFPRGPGPGQ